MALFLGTGLPEVHCQGTLLGTGSMDKHAGLDSWDLAVRASSVPGDRGKNESRPLGAQNTLQSRFLGSSSRCLERS
jgi:hypothetical protein